MDALRTAIDVFAAVVIGAASAIACVGILALALMIAASIIRSTIEAFK